MYRSSNASPYGFRIVGSCQNERRLVDWRTAFAAYSQCDPRAECEREAYLSAFTFGDAFRDHLNATGSTRGYVGECLSPWLWFDIDRDDIQAATTDSRRLASALVDRFAVAGDELLVFYSGSKGFHVGLPTSLWNPAPSTSFAATCRRFAESVASAASVAIDSGVYDRVRAFRSPNSRHAKTGRYKRWLSLHELLNLRPERIVSIAAEPEPFDIPEPPAVDANAVRLWRDAAMDIDQQRIANADRRSTGQRSTLNRTTLDFIRDGASNGERHRLLFSAAANLAEYGCSFDLAMALLGEAALDSGLSPSEVRRQIECGLRHCKGAP